MTNLIKSISCMFLYPKLIITDLIHPESILLVEVNSTPAILVLLHVPRMANSCPGSCFAIAISQEVLMLIIKLYFSMLFREISGLNVHSEIKCIRVTRSKKLPVWGGVDVQELTFENAIGAMQNVVVIVICIFSLVLDVC